MSKLPQIRLRGEDENDKLREEINLVIDQRVNELATNLSLSSRNQKWLRERLLQMEHRTYLWLHLAMEEIREAYQNSLYPNEVQIDSLPKSVDDAYERILQKINVKQKPNAQKVLCVILGARRPLTIREMALALGAARA
ncbi:hypothetical protein GJ744_006711 [Endocarpon pusillum]|uniref:DUF7069 domain-containing protein n=1 Tax=Endocarpon pusillum TaxID=364733 RepID=A0A8H7E5U2_9EURO|nr:hypothetical protein GJ744_006711 [Endocarpon pusillum]